MSGSYKNLLLGAGNSRDKKIHLPGEESWAGELVTIDMNPNCGADIVWDLERRPLPFGDAEFDEIHAYDVLEHWGRQGDWRAWFDEMAEYHRLLKPAGVMCVVVPINDDALADPGHTRFFSFNHFAFLNQKWYDEELKAHRPVTDYRWYWKLNFDVLRITSVNNHIVAILRKA